MKEQVVYSVKLLMGCKRMLLRPMMIHTIVNAAAYDADPKH